MPDDEGYPGIAHDMETLRAENAELRAALEEVLKHLPPWVRGGPQPVADVVRGGGLVDGGTMEFPRFDEAVKKARAALSRATWAKG